MRVFIQLLVIIVVVAVAAYVVGRGLGLDR